MNVVRRLWVWILTFVVLELILHPRMLMNAVLIQQLLVWNLWPTWLIFWKLDASPNGNRCLVNYFHVQVPWWEGHPGEDCHGGQRHHLGHAMGRGWATAAGAGMRGDMIMEVYNHLSSMILSRSVVVHATIDSFLNSYCEVCMLSVSLCLACCH